MQATTHQLKLNLPTQMYQFVQEKADMLGVTMSSYIKHLIISEVRQSSVPTFKASQKTERQYKKAMKEKKSALKTENIEEFLNDL
jgi:hypothetical protein